MFGRLVKIKRPTVLVVLALMSLFWLYFYLEPLIRMKRQNLINLRELLLVSISVAVKGGNEVYRVIQEHNMHESSKGKTKEGANDPVTNADYRSHCVMYYGIKTLFPHIKVISEESIAEDVCHQFQQLNTVSDETVEVDKILDETVGSNDVTVWIDPLDATQEYTEHLLHLVSTMVCVAVNGKPIIGVIHRPFESKSRTFWAWSGKAVSTDLQHISPNANVKRPIIIVSRSHAGKIKNIIEQAFNSNVEIVTAGGAGYKVLQLLNGNATAYVHSTVIKKWDICAGNALLNAVGGRMSTLSNEDIDYSSDTNVVNNGGILATISNHNWFFNKLNTLVKSR